MCVCVCVCAGPTAGRPMCVGGRNGSYFLRERRTTSETPEDSCPLTSEPPSHVTGPSVWYRSQGRSFSSPGLCVFICYGCEKVFCDFSFFSCWYHQVHNLVGLLCVSVCVFKGVAVVTGGHHFYQSQLDQWVWSSEDVATPAE